MFVSDEGDNNQEDKVTVKDEPRSEGQEDDTYHDEYVVVSYH